MNGQRCRLDRWSPAVTFPIDSTGRYILRVGVSGAEGTAFKVEFGGSAFQLMN